MTIEQSSPSFRSPANLLYHALMSGCGLIAALLFGAMGLLVCADVFMRNLGLGSLPWSVEVTEYMLMLATFVAAPWLLYVGDHIRIDILLRASSARGRWRLELLTDCLGLLICAVLAWQCVVVAIDSAQQDSMVFKVLIFPEWWLNLPMGFAFVLLTFEFARRVYAVVRHRGGR
ncbi:TRAP transporter small permease [Azoarcus sp. L1K30]|uniref:TRAP transporter small permease n=1 Tax=Azoarcus sp. L1K30 TaxID=2820277 RepID=UPI001B820D6F|nr:TRAP transporter small permease [Azoarcus sp. L1K30]MBR0568765.1 TRAP transporter small permease [Azoarcus sp. L1K30]